MRRPALALCAILAIVGSARADEPGLAVIVHPTRTTSLSVDDVARIFLRQRRFWDDGAPIVPINQAPTTPVRRLFTRRVLGMETTWLQRYWNERYFEGILPPLVMSSSGAVKRYVASEPNAIGYVSWDEVDESVRVAVRLR